MNSPHGLPTALYQLNELPLANSFASLPPAFYTRLQSTPLPAPYLVCASADAAKLAGLDPASFDDPQFVDVFSGNAQLAASLPLSAVYSGHQFGVWAGQLGDGRAILLGEVPAAAPADAIGAPGDPSGVIELQLKGAGKTPYSRMGDGRAVLRSSIREFLCSEAMAGLGIPTTRALCVVGSDLRVMRELPESTAVVTRMAPSFVRFGSFEHWFYNDRKTELATLADFVIARHYPWLQDDKNRYQSLLREVTRRSAELVAQWQAVGFMHGVLNTDNMNISGESFDYGPWRWLPQWDPGFTAAYFDHAGLYAFGRQPEALHWNCGQLAVALRLLVEAPPLIAALERFGPLYQTALARQFLWRLGVQSRGFDQDFSLIAQAEKTMRETGLAPDTFFHRHRFGRHAKGDLATALADYEPTGPDHDLWQEAAPPSLVIDQVETVWSAIERQDDWGPLGDLVAAIRRLGEALGPPPVKSRLSQAI